MRTLLASWKKLLPLAFGAAICSFGASTIVTQFQLRAIDVEARNIADNAIPSVQHLAAGQAALRQLRLLWADYVRGAAEAPDTDKLAAVRERIDRELNAYLALPLFPHEATFWQEVADRLAQLDGSIDRLQQQLQPPGAEAVEAAVEMRVEAERLLAATVNSLQFNATESHDTALRIVALRDRWERLAFGLDGLSFLLTLLAVTLTARAMAAHSALLEAHTKLVERRAEELDRFAGRVAHDIRGPLSAIGLAVQFAAKSGDPTRRGEMLGRGASSLKRIERIVDALLEFARAGARPSEDATADVNVVFGDLASDLLALAAENRVQLAFELSEPCAVACSPGVLISLTDNLVRNAIKYMGESTTRRVSVRIRQSRSGLVRFEVEDTGPGLPSGLQDTVFEPYVRGKGTGQVGIGLGLATVKRLAEAHGGRVGVSSRPGVGCLFWFELPRGSAVNKAPAFSADQPLSNHRPSCPPN